MDNLFSTHPSTENRIAALQHLAAEIGSGAGAQPSAPAYPRRSGGPWGNSAGRGEQQRGPWG
jgi:heat shock protein HtpX